MGASFGIFIVVLAIAVVVWLARSIGDEGVATSLDAPWRRFCEEHGFGFFAARPLVGEKWPMISGVSGDVSLFIDVLEEQLGTRKLMHTRLRATSTHPRTGVLRCTRRGISTKGRVIATGDALFDEELATVAENDDVARILCEATRSALLALAQRRNVDLEVDNGGITLLVQDVLHDGRELESAMEVLVQLATSRPSRGYR